MSNLERGAAALDDARAKRKGLLINGKIDFDGYMKAREADKDNVKSPQVYTEEVIELFYGDNSVRGTELPWSKTHESFRLREGEVTLWPGINGHGKSQVLGQVILNLMAQGQKCCIASFEMHPYKTLGRMTRQAVGANKPSEDYIRNFMGWCNGKLWLYDHMGTVTHERILGVIYYCAEQLGMQHFVVDSLMKCGIKSDDWNAQKEFIDKLCAAAKDTGCHIHLVAHSRKGDDEYSPPNKMDVAGSMDITNQVDNVMTVWRNKAKEKAIRTNKAKPEDIHKPDCLVICDKQRHGEWEGEIALWFDAPSMRYLASEHEKVWQMKL